MLSYQKRVVEEKRELDEKLGSLAAFLVTDTYARLDEAERGRLKRQAAIMSDYSAVLGERIAAFGGGA